MGIDIKKTSNVRIGVYLGKHSQGEQMKHSISNVRDTCVSESVGICCCSAYECLSYRSRVLSMLSKRICMGHNKFVFIMY
jgi:hypothetical protein